MGTSRTPAPPAPPAGRPVSSRAVSFRVNELDPPSSLYVTQDDRLLVRAWNSVASVAVVVRARILMPDGQVVPTAVTVRPSTDRVVSQGAVDLTEGFLLSLLILVEGAAPRRGQTFVTVALARGGALAADPAQLLAADYVAEGAPIGWPGADPIAPTEGPGLVRAVAGTDPAAGVEVSETVPTNARWTLYAVRFPLVTDATVANRRVHLLVDDGTNTLYEAAAPDVQAASLTRNYNAANHGFAPAATVSELYLNLPVPLPLLQGWRVRTATDSLQAGDNFGVPRLTVEEWIED